MSLARAPNATTDAFGRPAARAAAIPTRDLLAGLTVALVAIPQCVGFATIAGLPPASGLITAVIMGLVSAALSESPRLVIGPVITASTMMLGVLRTVAPDEPRAWPGLAGALAVLVGLLTVAGAVIGIGRLVRFVSRSVIVGLIVGSVMLTIGSQLAPVLGLPAGREPMLVGMLWNALRHLSDTDLVSLAMAAGVFALVLIGGRLDARFPVALVALALSGLATWLLGSLTDRPPLPTIGALHWRWTDDWLLALTGDFNTTDLLAGAAAISLVGMIQNLAIGKALALRSQGGFDPRRELWSLGIANVAAGAAGGFAGSASFARSALADVAGARTRLSSLIAAAATGLVALVATPLTRYITTPAIGGLLMATTMTMIDWSELRALLRDVHDRPVLLTMVVCVLVLPIHWAILIGLAVSFIVLLRRVSRIHIFEMVRSAEGPFREQDMDEQTGCTAVTMIQLEGPLFFAHADLLAARLRQIFQRGPRVTILRMRRTQQIDFSILATVRAPVADYLAAGGHLIICGLTPKMRAVLLNSPLGEIIGPDFLLETTREVFGSAHVALGLAQCILSVNPAPQRPDFRTQQAARL